MAILPSRALGASPEARSTIAAALKALDAFSFWVVPADEPSPGGLIVVGSTGGFFVAACDLSGRLETGRGAPTVGGYVVPSLRATKGAAKQVTATLGRASVFVDVQPVMCLTRAVAGAPVESKGVRLIHVRDLASDLAARPRALEQGRAQRAARALGVAIAGDRKRHFTRG